MIFKKMKKIDGNSYYNAHFQNDINFRIVKNIDLKWQVLISMYSSLVPENDKFIEYGKYSSLSKAKEQCEVIAKNFSIDTGIDKDTIDVYNKDASNIALIHESLIPHRIYELINQYFIKNADTADIGCGIGRDTNWLNLNGFPCVGVDASDGMIKEAVKKYSNVKFVLDYLPALNCFEHSQFQNILCSAVLMHLDEKSFISACVRLSQLLRINGCLIISFRESNRKNNREENKLYTPINIDLLKSVFEHNNCKILMYETELEIKREINWYNIVIKK
jgi:2-polyprenyl-3-methyl-5-hydroxy-6-metoxy-1,4-benzoquinol methylase